MDGYLQNKIQEIVARKKEKNKKTLLLSVISVVLALTVSYLSVFPAITMKGNPICGTEEHTHTEACYEDMLICGHEEDEGHVHTDACYQEVKTSVCEKEEHTHTDACYQEVKTLVCPLQEDENHTHTESCYKTERVLICGKEEYTHTEECFKTEKILICDQEEREAHTHTAECYEKHLICGKTEHMHTQDCYRHDFYQEDLLRVYEDDDVTVTVTLTEESMIPAEAELVVLPITEESDKIEFDALAVKAGEAALDEDQVISDIRFYNISFKLNGENIEPAEGSVKVSIRFNNPVFSMDDMKRASDLKVLHFEDGGAVVDVTDVIENAEEGVTAVEFSTDSFSSFSIVLADTIITGNFYQRVNTIDSTTASYLIVSAQGNYALSSTQSGYSRAITMTPVRGNPEHYDVKVGAAGANTFADINWTFLSTVSGTTGTSQIRVSSTQRLSLNNSPIIQASTTISHTLERSTVTGSWTIRYGSGTVYYLSNTPTTGVFSRSTATTDVDYRNVVIYKLVNTTLTVPGEVVYDDGTGLYNDDGEKPPYPAYINPTGTQTGAFSTSSGRSFSAVSDPGTSKIEDLFDGVKSDDGKVITDKSVLYGKDDYQAFTAYNDGNFSVTLSALAQEYNVPIEEQLISPIDVAIVLDVSGSMATAFEGQSRAYHAVKALNDTITYIMTLHPANRVGLVLFTAGSVDMLPLGRFYVGTSGAIIDYSNNYQYLTFSGTTTANMSISTTANLRFTDTRALVPANTFNSSSGLGGWMGTYTQLGIQRGANILLNNNDITYTIPTSGEVVNRIPVMVMISDGEPTHSTNNYMDPLSGPHYGSGTTAAGATGNGKGVHGYNTILSEVYFKKVVASHYKEVSKWYAIGLGIIPTGTAASSVGSGDHYKRAVLSPTPDTIDFLTSDPSATNHTYSSLMLSQLLKGTYAASTVAVESTTGQYASYPTPQIGITNRLVPVAQHDFTGFNLANESYFGDFNAVALAVVLMGVIDRSRTVYNYNFSLKEILSMEHVHMTDPIGDGMEVKGEPVLRHNGVNYLRTSVSSVTVGGVETTTYRYNYQTTDSLSGQHYNLNNIGVDVITATDGTQTVEMHIMSPEMPVYHPDASFSFYYEALPVRLIYQVGLTAQTVATARKNDVFYTNRWQNGSGATSQLRPTDGNLYYQPATYTNIFMNKTANSTSTANTSLFSDNDGDIYNHFLGNNGKITVTDAPTTTAVTVNKIWRRYDTSQILNGAELALLPDITVRLYRSITPGDAGSLVDTVMFGNTQAWTYSWTALPIEDASLNPYYYSIVEESVDGYITTYQNNGGIPGGTITVDNTAGGMILPATGGVGLMPFIAGGLTVMIFMLMIVGCLFYIKKRKYERGLPRSPDG